MTPGEFKRGGENLTICYQFVDSTFGLMLVASTDKGICYMGFVGEDPKETFTELNGRFPRANFIEHDRDIHHMAAKLGHAESDEKKSIKLHIKGTDFQLKVWEALLKIPLGKLNTYGDVAKIINRPKASRAVGTAIGSNPVAFLIPCHRVIRASGVSGGYMWGPERKTAMIGWEAAQISDKQESFLQD
ncbi:Bifunctional transcriptional activator/DNA repair enzyme Ada [Nymphon striatum]|nr:Bifunctional transcriptional activator/DNA repair enzyme Ada [Nymphon striatum]